MEAEAHLSKNLTGQENEPIYISAPGKIGVHGELKLNIGLPSPPDIVTVKIEKLDYDYWYRYGRKKWDSYKSPSALTDLTGKYRIVENFETYYLWAGALYYGLYRLQALTRFESTSRIYLWVWRRA